MATAERWLRSTITWFSINPFGSPTQAKYSWLPLNPCLSVDTPGYGLSGSMGLKDGPKNRTQKIMKTSRKNQFCIFEACEAILGAKARVEICMSNNVNYINPQ